MSKHVIILGGGVAGMSAAHELIERGFRVTVFEKQACIPGGKARSVDVPKTKTEQTRALPGEHGFRFFPGFYKHIIDTLKRIPYHTTEWKGSVYNNLVECEDIMMARIKQKTIYLPSHFPRSGRDLKMISDSIKILKSVLKPGELDLIGNKVWQLMTSCELRRIHDYERLGWWEFTEASAYSEEYQSLFVNGLTRTLVAAKAETCNTKTNGNILLQMIFDLLNPFKQNDRILNGPTNDVWLFPWLKYLKERGVEYFFNSEVVELSFDEREINGVWVETDEKKVKYTADYYLCALPVERTAELLSKNKEIFNLDKSLENILRLKDDVAWMNGIQFYLKKDVSINKGHIIMADTPWALTAISQAQYWTIDLKEYGNRKVEGIISVDVSNWENDGICIKKPANRCNEKEVIEEVWEQMKASLNKDGQILLDEANLELIYVDGAILFGNELHNKTGFLDSKMYEPSKYGSKGINHNEEPLLVNTTNSWALRNDAKTDIPNFFLASDYVRSNTDLATMEGANEAARRAVNHIIDSSGVDASYCKIWKFKEPWWLCYYKWVDKRRFERGLEWKVSKPWFASLLNLILK